MQNRQYRFAVPFIASVLLASAGIAGADEKGSQPSLRYAETVRKETKDAYDGNRSQSMTSFAGKTRFTLVVPISPDAARQFAKDTEISIGIGDWSLKRLFKEDPKWEPGRKAVSVVLADPPEANKARFVFGKLDLRWDSEKLTVNFQMNRSAVGAKFLQSGAGEYQLDQRIDLSVGPIHEVYHTLVRAKLASHTGEDFFHSKRTTVVNMEFKAEGKLDAKPQE